MRKFNQEMFNYLKIHGKEHIIKEWVEIVDEKFNEKFTLKEMQHYFVRHCISFKYEMPKKKNNGKPSPIGSERINSNGMIQVKVAPKKWENKQRLIYEQYYGVKLKEDEYVIFLDQNRTNFDINNLKLVTRQESAYMINQRMFSKNKEATKTGILVTKLVNKTKNKALLESEVN